MRSQSASVELDHSAWADHEEIRAHVARITESREFARSPRLARFLCYVVENTLAGRSEEIKESLIGVEVYGRSPDYSPQIDSTVRVEAGRLRTRLRWYYEGAGLDESLRIELPKGSYVPVFEATARMPMLAAPTIAAPVLTENADMKAPLRVPHPAAASRSVSRMRVGGAVALVIGLATAMFLWAGRQHDDGRTIDSVAVLPFANLSGDAGTALFADGLTEEVTTALGRESGIRVISRTATAQYKHSSVDVSRVGRELRVRAVLQGSVRREGNRVTVTTQLIDAVNGFHIWADRYERESADVSNAQNVFARTMMGALREVLRVRPAAAPVAGDTLALYNQANDLLRIPVLKNGQPEQLPASVLEAVQRFREVTIRSPRFAKGWAGLAEAAEWEYELRGNRPAERLTEAKSAALRAVQLDPAGVEGWTVLSSILLYREWDFKGAKAACRRLIDLDPRNAVAWRRYIDVLRLEGRTADAQVELQRVIAIQPASAPMRLRRASLLYEQGRYEESLNEARAAGQLTNQFPFYPATIWLQGVCLQQLGRLAEAEKTYRSALAVQPHDLWSESALAHLMAETGRRRKAEAILTEMREHRSRGRMTHVAEALVLIALGRKSEALSSLELGFRERDDCLPFVALDPRFRPLASDARFRAVVAKVGVGLGQS